MLKNEPGQPWSWDSKIDSLKNELMEWTGFLHVCENSQKLKVDSMILVWAWSKMNMTI